MLRKIALLLSVLLAAVIIYSCSDRGFTAVSNEYLAGQSYTAQHYFHYYLQNSMFDDISKFSLVRFQVYMPHDSATGVDLGQTPYPVLYLLSPFGEDEFFYINHGLMDIADRMIASGEIKPMIIVSVDGSSGYGSSFYGDSYAGGRYEQICGFKAYDANTGSLATLIDYIDNVFRSRKTRATRAVSGVDVGGYGAMRVAIKYSENFSSVSAVSAPLSFGGADGEGGFVPLFKQVINELDTTYKAMDISTTHPLQTVFFAAATSFSPHDTGLVGDGYVIDDTTTYFALGGGAITVHLPFDETGDPYTPIWDLWLANDVNSILTDFPGSLDTTAVLLMASTQADYGLYEQTLDFHNRLTVLGKTHQYLEYSGYSGYQATGTQFTYDILPKILKFHSDHFIF
jgi:hypothetical protein